MRETVMRELYIRKETLNEILGSSGVRGKQQGQCVHLSERTHMVSYPRVERKNAISSREGDTN